MKAAKITGEEKTFRRLHLFEFEDFPWFPGSIRSGGTDYLRYFLIRTELYKPTINLLYEALNKSGERRIIDLCSGGGGYIEQIHKGLSKLDQNRFTVTLTDKFPNVDAYELIKKRNNNQVDYCSEPVDIFHVPKDLEGFRVLFSAIHHFRPGQVKSILQDAVKADAPVAFFDGERSALAILGILLIHPVAFILFTPFFKPFKLSRLFFTYVLPLIPLYTIWDGIVSILRMYEPEELYRLATSLDATHYVWSSGKTKNRFGIRSSYLIGYPKK